MNKYILVTVLLSCGICNASDTVEDATPVISRSVNSAAVAIPNAVSMLSELQQAERDAFSNVGEVKDWENVETSELAEYFKAPFADHKKVDLCAVDACRYLSKSKNSEGVDKYVFAPGNITDFRHWRKVLSKAGIKTNKVFLSGNTKRNTFPENAAPRARLAVSFLLPSNQDVVKKISGFEAVTVSYSRASAIAYAKLRVAQESSMLRAQGAEIIGVHSFEDGDDIMFEIYYLPSAK